MNKLFAFGVVFAVALSAQASYLKWQVGTSVGDNLSAVDAYESWDTAVFYQVDSSSGSKVKTSLGTLKNLGSSGEAGPGIVDLGNAASSGYSYYVELVNNSVGTVGYSSEVSYASLSAIVVENYPTPEIVPAMTTWHGGTYKATPEPTSAMLMLLGVAGLALRRKQRKLA